MPTVKIKLSSPGTAEAKANANTWNREQPYYITPSNDLTGSFTADLPRSILQTSLQCRKTDGLNPGWNGVRSSEEARNILEDRVSKYLTRDRSLSPESADQSEVSEVVDEWAGLDKDVLDLPSEDLADIVYEEVSVSSYADPFACSSGFDSSVSLNSFNAPTPQVSKTRSMR